MKSESFTFDLGKLKDLAQEACGVAKQDVEVSEEAVVVSRMCRETQTRFEVIVPPILQMWRWWPHCSLTPLMVTSLRVL